MSLVEDERGRLLVTAIAPVSGWRALPKPPPVAKPPQAVGSSRGLGMLRSGLPPDSIAMKQLATVIEILDPATGRVVVSGRVDGQIVRLLSANLAYSIRESTDGVAVVDIWRILVH
jgi:hypothetical protein